MPKARPEPASPASPPELEVPPAIVELVERFERNIEAYTAPAYNETQVRREFLDPFFEALGWDVNNTAGYAEAYKDVIHEDAIKVSGSARAPDYCFRIGGQRKFFVEAKKPNVYIKEDIQPAYQLRRYAWSAKLPLSIVTDFEEFAVYDCRVKPDRTDKASVARVMYMTFRDYPSQWQEIAKIFSPDAIRKGSFDRYADGNRAKRGTTEVDDAFLAEIESWREALAKNIALRNTKLSQHDVNFAVQRTIDRIVFLRICEDRGIEDYGRLQTLLKGDGIYARLCERFQRADEKYNSGLFHFRQERDRSETPDSLTPALAIDDAPLRQVLGALYYPESPYVFAEIPADILGQVYERFLGKIIRLTAGHQAKIEEKPEVRKAGGVYYTPTYIVDHIVRATLGPLVDGRKPADVAKLRILDPACGSGSFLLGAYQFLLDWHREAYVASGPEKWAKGKTPALFRGPRGDWQLTTAKRKEILLNNIFGVDLDAQAIEVTKLSLLLKVLEGETEERVNRNHGRGPQRARSCVDDRAEIHQGRRLESSRPPDCWNQRDAQALLRPRRGHRADEPPGYGVARGRPGFGTAEGRHPSLPS
jgi:restriction-modification enzyme MmeI-like protein/type I restriction and modification enzyme subunit R-like protein